jgi:4'-phosphopantetheinyl transferase EntD
MLAAPHQLAPTLSLEAPFAIALAQPSDRAGRFLSRNERAELGLVVNGPRRADWCAGRLAAKRSVAAVTGIGQLASIELRGRPGAAPTAISHDCTGMARALPLALSLTHCDGFGAAVASATFARVGIDLEREWTVAPSHTRYFLTDAERAVAAEIGPTAMWTLKEAAWKALGCGDDTFFTAIELCCTPGGQVRAVSVFGAEIAATSRLSMPWPGFVLAVVALTGDLQ